MLLVHFYELRPSCLLSVCVYLLFWVGSTLGVFRLTCILNLKVSLLCCGRLFEESKAGELLVVHPVVPGRMHNKKEGSVKSHLHLICQKKKNPTPIFHVLSNLAWKQICEEHILVVALVLLLPFITFCNSFGNCLGSIFYLTWHKYLSVLQEDIYPFPWYLNFFLLFASGLCCIISGQRPMHSYGSHSVWAMSLNYHHLTVCQKSSLLLEGKSNWFTVTCIPEFSCVLRQINVSKIYNFASYPVNKFCCCCCCSNI